MQINQVGQNNTANIRQQDKEQKITNAGKTQPTNIPSPEGITGALKAHGVAEIGLDNSSKPKSPQTTPNAQSKLNKLNKRR